MTDVPKVLSSMTAYMRTLNEVNEPDSSRQTMAVSPTGRWQPSISNLKVYKHSQMTTMKKLSMVYENQKNYI